MSRAPGCLTPRLAGIALAAAVASCGDRSVGTVALGDHQPAVESTADQPPVAINPVTPMSYPPALLEQGIEGRVLLRLFVDAQGKLIPDSTRLAESSGYPALDSAALSGSQELRFSPALRNGRAIAAPFLQPVHLRHPRSRSDP
ncbi:MAG: energy transducer TonB [Gemmatimonadales bacterium]